MNDSGGIHYVVTITRPDGSFEPIFCHSRREALQSFDEALYVAGRKIEITTFYYSCPTCEHREQNDGE